MLEGSKSMHRYKILFGGDAPIGSYLKIKYKVRWFFISTTLKIKSIRKGK